MKKSSVLLFIILACAFITLAWLIDYPYRYALLTCAIVFATAALVITLKGKN